ncbi:MAG: 50S ribosomal protein L29 [Anaerolineae bacterium]|nr:50S ribosomal protein L29 [Anaerolineae bacterium]
MDVREIRNMDDEKILDEIEDLKEALFRLRLQESSGQLENTDVIRHTKRDIARLKTVQRERALAAAQAAGEVE